MFNSISEVCTYLTEVLGEESSHLFEEKIENFVCYVKMAALTNPVLTESSMKKKIKKQAVGIITASVKTYLDKNFSENGNVVINIGYGRVYDKDMKPIKAINKIRDSQSEIVKNIINIGMGEFIKGRELAYSIADRLQRQDEENGYHYIGETNDTENNDSQKTIDDRIYQIKDEIRIIESRLPKIGENERHQLLALYEELRIEKLS